MQAGSLSQYFAGVGVKSLTGTEVDPAAWWSALQEALALAGGLDDVAAVAVGGQQHGPRLSGWCRSPRSRSRG